MTIPASAAGDDAAESKKEGGPAASEGAAPLRPVRHIVEQLDALSDSEKISVREIIQNFGRTSFLPMLLVPALMLVSPLSGIPLFSTFCGLWIVAVALQRLARRERLWLPGLITRREVSGAALHRAAGRLRWVADWLDRNSRPRLRVLVTPPLSLLAYFMCAVAGLVIPFLELVPFSSSILGLLVALVAVGLLVRDGVYLIVAVGVGAVAASIPAFLVSQVVN
ncbi:exopolysaccharide biosynthesis protein [Oceaniglobus trochenteri]|uniref:exopolysaccharide biosynthesis protein n=1 Tax=Oceaniglobus trochenteri TaxID=2763260 RepID=UPI001CFFF6CC|nr:exopolysaccharide biosynthesis protein [Oceaniglobus trochenteri]